jgi:hypothetical protein
MKSSHALDERASTRFKIRRYFAAGPHGFSQETLRGCISVLSRSVVVFDYERPFPNSDPISNKLVPSGGVEVVALEPAALFVLGNRIEVGTGTVIKFKRK